MSLICTRNEETLTCTPWHWPPHRPPIRGLRRRPSGRVTKNRILTRQIRHSQWFSLTCAGSFDVFLTHICYKKHMNELYRSYLLRLWLEPNDPPVWRAMLENPANGERHGFSDLKALFSFLEQDTEKLENEIHTLKENLQRGELT